MAKKQTDPALWLPLYTLATAARELASWQWMYEDEIFGLRLPGDTLTWYASIMGSGGEHFTYCFYRGDAALADFLRLRQLSKSSHGLLSPFSLLSMQNCLQVAFENRENVPDEQKERLKALGLRFRGAHQWITVTDYKAGLYPWPVDAAQALPLRQLLQQAMVVTAHKREKPRWFGSWNKAGQIMPIFQAIDKGDTLFWEESRMAIDPGPARHSAASGAAATFPAEWNAVRRKPAENARLAIGELFVPNPVQEHKNQRPYFPTIFLMIDLNSGMVVGMMSQKAEDHKALELSLLKVFQTWEARPSEIQLADAALIDVFEPFFNLAGIQLRVTNEAAKQTQAINQQLQMTGLR